LTTSDPNYNMKYECENKDLTQLVNEQFYLDDKCTNLYQTHGYPENECFSKIVGVYQKAICTKTQVFFRDFGLSSTCSGKNEVVRKMGLGECIRMSSMLWVKYTCPRETVEKEPETTNIGLVILLFSSGFVVIIGVGIALIVSVVVIYLIIKKSKANSSSVYGDVPE
jgi:hypothetical protein